MRHWKRGKIYCGGWSRSERKKKARVECDKQKKEGEKNRSWKEKRFARRESGGKRKIGMRDKLGAKNMRMKERKKLGFQGVWKERDKTKPLGNMIS